MEHITEPMFCDTPFSLKWPVDNAFVSCCCSCTLPNVRGIPTGSVPLPQHEKDELLKNLEGNWKIRPVAELGTRQGGKRAIFQDALFHDGALIISGGVHIAEVRRPGGHTEEVVKANGTQRQPLNFFRGTAGELYIDNTGSMFTRMDFAGGEIEIDNSLGMKVLLQRGWKRDGLPPTQQTMDGGKPPVVVATVIGRVGGGQTDGTHVACAAALLVRQGENHEGEAVEASNATAAWGVCHDGPVLHDHNGHYEERGDERGADSTDACTVQGSASTYAATAAWTSGTKDASESATEDTFASTASCPATGMKANRKELSETELKERRRQKRMNKKARRREREAVSTRRSRE